MLKQIVIYGAGGFAREVAHLIEQINLNRPTWELLGFLDDNVENHNQINNGFPVLGGDEWLIDNPKISIALGIGSPEVKESIVNKLKKNKDIEYPNLIHPNVYISKYNSIGKGNIICEGNILTTNITINNFVTLNLNCSIGHDVEINDFVTILPKASISGNVKLESKVNFGTHATVIQGLIIGKESIVGAGSVIIRDVPGKSTVVGTPAKQVKFL
ncbi:acetyltransferase [Solibacillus daqui]|uniref:acetyltransferase n=1 Tax=Solibacillus daqui TaxID=2912187 RepID=UPI002365739A|nr:acetyltransferase [Solibacillus daqui]